LRHRRIDNLQRLAALRVRLRRTGGGEEQHAYYFAHNGNVNAGRSLKAPNRFLSTIYNC
jgi:hypothetical protein